MTLDSFTPRTRKVLGSLLAIGLILAGAFFIYAQLMSPTKQPYRDALAQYKNVYNANVAFTNSGAAINATKATDEQFKNNIANVTTALKSLKTETTALGKQDVLTEGEGKALYDAFSKKAQKYFAYNEAVIASIEMLRPVLYPCLSQATGANENQAAADAMRSCAARMGEMDTLPDADYRAFATSFEGIYNAIADNIDAVAALADPEGVDTYVRESLEEDRQKLMNDLTKASSTLAKNLQANRVKVDITPEAVALDTYLRKRSSVFSF